MRPDIQRHFSPTKNMAWFSLTLGSHDVPCHLADKKLIVTNLKK